MEFIVINSLFEESPLNDSDVFLYDFDNFNYKYLGWTCVENEILIFHIETSSYAKYIGGIEYFKKHKIVKTDLIDKVFIETEVELLENRIVDFADNEYKLFMHYQGDGAELFLAKGNGDIYNVVEHIGASSWKYGDSFKESPIADSLPNLEDIIRHNFLSIIKEFKYENKNKIGSRFEEIFLKLKENHDIFR